MQWWGALTNQFAQLATSAMKDSATDAAKTLAGNMLKQSFDSAAAGFKAAAQRAGEGGHRRRRGRARCRRRRRQGDDAAEGGARSAAPAAKT